MVVNPIVSGGGGSKRYKFTYNSDMTMGDETLNGASVSKGQVVELEAGSENVLYTPNEGAELIADSGFEIPWKPISEPPLTRAVPGIAVYVSFVMPNENCIWRNK